MISVAKEANETELVAMATDDLPMTSALVACGNGLLLEGMETVGFFISMLSGVSVLCGDVGLISMLTRVLLWRRDVETISMLS